MRRSFLLVGLSLLSHCLFGADTLPLNGKTTPQKLEEAVNQKLNAQKPGQPQPTEIESDHSDSEEEGHEAKPFIATVDTYGSTRINEGLIRKFWGKELDAWLAKGIKGEESALQDEEKLLAKIQEKFQFGFAQWSVIEYFMGTGIAIHVTLDTVEKEDMAARMTFLTPPSKELKDPAGLIKQWEDYKNIALKLVELGEITPEAEVCKTAFHCPFGHEHAKLKSFEKIFTTGVKRYQKELAEILREDKREEFRANAAFLLAYAKDGNQVAAWMLERVKDPSEVVRNNVLRVLGDISEFHPSVVIPIKPVLEALYFPRVSDRSKAVNVIANLITHSQSSKAEVMAHVPVLLQLLSSKQPDHFEIAHAILRKISGKEYAASELQAWQNWYTKQPKDRALSKK